MQDLGRIDSVRRFLEGFFRLGGGNSGSPLKFGDLGFVLFQGLGFRV